MHYVIKEQNKTPVLVYEAPVDEKTLEMRKKFDVDEKTGYPRMYNWRRMASLGNEFRPDEPFYKLGDNSPEQSYSTKVSLVCITAFLVGTAQWAGTVVRGKSFWLRPHYPLGAWAVISGLALWGYEKTGERQALKDSIYVDYIRKHPERFESIHRPKLREVLFEYCPVR